MKPRRLLALLIACLRLAAAGGGGGEEEAARVEGAATELEAATPAAEDSAGGGAERSAPLRKVRGPAGEVARELRAKGFDARVRASSVVVEDAEAEDGETALRDRPPGAGAVFVE